MNIPTFITILPMILNILIVIVNNTHYKSELLTIIIFFTMIMRRQAMIMTIPTYDYK